MGLVEDLIKNVEAGAEAAYGAVHSALTRDDLAQHIVDIVKALQALDGRVAALETPAPPSEPTPPPPAAESPEPVAVG